MGEKWKAYNSFTKEWESLKKTTSEIKGFKMVCRRRRRRRVNVVPPHIFRMKNDLKKQLAESRKSLDKRIERAKKVVERFNFDPNFKFLHERISDLFAQKLRSDMEMLKSGKLNKISLAAIVRKFREKGYGECVPEIVFLNLRESWATPVPAMQPGVALVSGFSKNLMTMFLEEYGIVDPVAVMEIAISGVEYQNLVVVD